MHGTRGHYHTGGRKAAAGQRGADIPEAMHLVGQLVKRLPRQSQFVLDGQHAGRRNDQVCLDVFEVAQKLQQTLCVHSACCAGHPDNEAPFTAHSAASASFSTVCSSPLASISPMMSEPPMNSPLT